MSQKVKYLGKAKMIKIELRSLRSDQVVHSLTISDTEA